MYDKCTMLYGKKCQSTRSVSNSLPSLIIADNEQKLS